jgi:hypothetical protein
MNRKCRDSSNSSLTKAPSAGSSAPIPKMKTGGLLKAPPVPKPMKPNDRRMSQNAYRTRHADGNMVPPQPGAPQQPAVDTSSLAGSVDKYSKIYNPKQMYAQDFAKQNPNTIAQNAENYNKAYTSDYNKFVGADNSKSQGILNQSPSIAPGQSNGIDYNAMRARLQAKGRGEVAPQVDRRSDQYKQAVGAQNDAYRNQAMAETQQNKARSQAFGDEIHRQTDQFQSDALAKQRTAAGFKKQDDGTWKRGVWDQMKADNPTLTKAFGWIPGAKEFSEAGARGDIGGMINAGKQAVTGAQNMADKADPYIEKAQKFMPHKKGGKVQNADHSKNFVKATKAVKDAHPKISQKKKGGSVSFNEAHDFYEGLKKVKKDGLRKVYGIPKDKKIPKEFIEQKMHSKSNLIRKFAKQELQSRKD